MSGLSIPRLYAILDLQLLHDRGLPPEEVLDSWLRSGVRLIQLRAKAMSLGPMLGWADACQRRCHAAGASLVVNDRADVAALSGAAGLHLGQDDLPVNAAKRLLSPDQFVGLSTHNISQVRAAVEQNADYIAAGPVYATATKLRPDPVIGLEGVSEAARIARRAGRALVAIGGITLETAPKVIEAGADAVAVISDLVPNEWRTRAAAYLEALKQR